QVPYGVTVDRSGNIYVADSYGSHIQKFDSSDNYVTQWGFPDCSIIGQFSFPGGVAVDGSGNVYVVDAYKSNQIQKFDSSGNYIAQWGDRGTSGGFAGPVAVDSSGN